MVDVGDAGVVGRPLTTPIGEIGGDPWVLAFTLVVSIATGVAFGTFPRSRRVSIS